MMTYDRRRDRRTEREPEPKKYAEGFHGDERYFILGFEQGEWIATHDPEVVLP